VSLSVRGVPCYSVCGARGTCRWRVAAIARDRAIHIRPYRRHRGRSSAARVEEKAGGGGGATVRIIRIRVAGRATSVRPIRSVSTRHSLVKREASPRP
jgi:hypothetical protein